MEQLATRLEAISRPILSEMGIPNEMPLQWQRTRKDFEGELTLVTFPLTKLLKKGPEQIGQAIGEALKSGVASISDYNVVKGFLNIKMSDAYWVEYLMALRKKENHGFAAPSSKETIMVEYSSPNTNKPLHLGHLRNNFLGSSVSAILEAYGHEVKKVQIVNDRGIHICKSMYTYMRQDLKETPESTGIKGDLLVGKYYVAFDQLHKKETEDLIASGLEPSVAKEEAPSMQGVRELLRKWEQKEPETYALWETMNNWVYAGWEQTYARMGVSFDKNYYESQTYLLGKEVVHEGLDKGIFIQEDDGSIWADLEGDGLDRKILQRSDGTTVYMTQDIGTAIMRFEENPGLSAQIYTVGNEQEYHFRVLFTILDKLGYDWAKNCYHLSYGMVELPEGKMKTREGTVVDADDLMASMVQTAKEITQELGKLDGVSETERDALYETIGLGALKYFLLKVDPKKKIMFDPKGSIDFQGNTAPFIQYTHARIKSILKKHDANPKTLSPGVALKDKERELIALLHDFEDVVAEAACDYSPALVANYVYDLVKVFNQYYQSTPILTDDGTEAELQLRINLISSVADVISRGMGLLGISVPNQM